MYFWVLKLVFYKLESSFTFINTCVELFFITLLFKSLYLSAFNLSLANLLVTNWNHPSSFFVLSPICVRIESIKSSIFFFKFKCLRLQIGWKLEESVVPIEVINPSVEDWRLELKSWLMESSLKKEIDESGRRRNC